MRFWFDTEFIEDGRTIVPLSLGIVAEDGREFYVEFRSAERSHANEWVQENVIPHLAPSLDGLWRDEIAPAVLAFVGDERPEWWAYYADYDWVLLCQLYGRMVDLPKGWPMFCMDVKQLAVHLGNPRLPEHDVERHGPEHHALADARWTRDAHLWLDGGTR
jgi:hypothetical protein